MSAGNEEGQRTSGRAPFWVAARVAAGGALAACSGDHDFLAQKPGDAAGPIVDVAVVDVRAEERRVAPPPTDVFDASQLDAMDQSEPPEPPEPPGRFSFTWMNGLVDVERARFCFVPAMGDREMRDRALGPTTLSFGKSAVFDELRGIDLSAMDLHAYAVVGVSLGADGAESCGAVLDAQDAATAEDGGARDPVVLQLPRIPAGTLAEGRSYLGVVTGCARPWPYSDVEGGSDAGDAQEDGDVADASRDTSQPDGDDVATDTADAADGRDGDADPRPADVMPDIFRPPRRASICGASTGAPNAGLVMVRLSRRDVGATLGFQAVHASAAVGAARVTIERPGGTAPALSADIGPFQIVPRDGLIRVTLEDFGPTVGGARVTIASPVGTFATIGTSLGAALAESDITESGLALGDRFSLVLIGAEPGQNAGPPWNAARVAIVRNAPFLLGN